MDHAWSFSLPLAFLCIGVPDTKHKSPSACIRPPDIRRHLHDLPVLGFPMHTKFLQTPQLVTICTRPLLPRLTMLSRPPLSLPHPLVQQLSIASCIGFPNAQIFDSPSKLCHYQSSCIGFPDAHEVSRATRMSLHTNALWPSQNFVLCIQHY